MSFISSCEPRRSGFKLQICVGESFTNSCDCIFWVSSIQLYLLSICCIEIKPVCTVPNQSHKEVVQIHNHSSDLTEKPLTRESGDELYTLHIL